MNSSHSNDAMDKSIWAGRAPMEQAMSRVTQVVTGRGPPSRTDMVAIFVFAAVACSGILAVLRPPMVTTRPRNDYEHPALAPLAVMCWGILAGLGTVGLRLLWN